MAEYFGCWVDTKLYVMVDLSEESPEMWIGEVDRITSEHVVASEDETCPSYGCYSAQHN